MNKPELYERLLKKLPTNIESLEVLKFIDSGEFKTAETNAHTIKGVAGNLSITPLFTAYTEIVNLLRAEKPAQARQILIDTLPIQEKFVDCIKNYA